MKLSGTSEVSMDVSPIEIANAFSNAWASDKAKIIDQLGFRYMNGYFVDGLVESIINEIKNEEESIDYVYAMDFLVNLKNALNNYV